MKWLLGILFALAAMATNGAELPLERIKLRPVLLLNCGLA